MRLKAKTKLRARPRPSCSFLSPLGSETPRRFSRPASRLHHRKVIIPPTRGGNSPPHASFRPAFHSAPPPICADAGSSGFLHSFFFVCGLLSPPRHPPLPHPLNVIDARAFEQLLLPLPALGTTIPRGLIFVFFLFAFLPVGCVGDVASMTSRTPTIGSAASVSSVGPTYIPGERKRTAPLPRRIHIIEAA